MPVNCFSKIFEGLFDADGNRKKGVTDDAVKKFSELNKLHEEALKGKTNLTPEEERKIATNVALDYHRDITNRLNKIIREVNSKKGEGEPQISEVVGTHENAKNGVTKIVKEYSKKIKSEQDALQKPSTGEVLQRKQDGVGKKGGESGRVESSVKGETTSTESKPTEKTTETKQSGGSGGVDVAANEAEGSGNTTGIKNEVTKEERAQKGLSEVEVEVRRSFGDAFEKGKKMVDDGTIDPRILAKELSQKPRPLSAEESVALIYDRMRLQNEYTKVLEDISKNHGNEVLSELLKNKLDDIESAKLLNDEASRKTGYEQGLGLAARKMMIKDDYSLLNQVTRFKAANNGEELPKEVREMLETKTKELESAQSKLDEYEEKIKNLEAQAKINKEVKSSPKKTNKSTEEFKKEREDIFKKIKDKWDKASKGSEGLTAVPLPYTAQLKAIAPEVLKLVKSYAEQGIIKLEDIVADLHANLSNQIPEITKKDVTDILAGEYTEKKTKLAPDREKMQLQSNVNKIKNQIDLEKQKIELGNRNKFQKGLDYFQKWRRFALLSGVKVLGKIGVAAGTRSFITTPIESVVGQGLKKLPILSKIAEGAPREGAGFNPKAEAKALSVWFDKATYKDIIEVVKTGHGELDYLHDKKLYPSNGWLDFMGQLHAAIKTLPKRAEYFRSFEIRAEYAAKKGFNLSDPIVQQEISVGAYNDAVRSIFMQDNYVTDAYKSIIRSLENSKISGSKTSAEVLKFLFPIVKVPTNYVAEESSYIFGGLKAAVALRKGIKDLTPEQKDFVFRAFKKQTIGLAFMALGYFNPQSVGGYYSGKRKEGDLEAGDVELFGVKLPHWMLHTPLWEALQVGSTVRRARDSNDKKGKPNNPITGTTTVIGGLIGQVPFYSQGSQIGSAFKSVDAAKAYLFRTGQSVVEPQLIKEVAGWSDLDKEGNPVKRESKDFTDYLKSGIPVVRQTLPIKGKKVTVQRSQAK